MINNFFEPAKDQAFLQNSKNIRLKDNHFRSNDSCYAKNALFIIFFGTSAGNVNAF